MAGPKTGARLTLLRAPRPTKPEPQRPMPMPMPMQNSLEQVGSAAGDPGGIKRQDRSRLQHLGQAAGTKRSRRSLPLNQVIGWLDGRELNATKQKAISNDESLGPNPNIDRLSTPNQPPRKTLNPPDNKVTPSKNREAKANSKPLPTSLAIINFSPTPSRVVKSRRSQRRPRHNQQDGGAVELSKAGQAGPPGGYAARSPPSAWGAGAAPNSTNKPRQRPCNVATTAAAGRWEPEGCQSPRVVRRQRSDS